MAELKPSRASVSLDTLGTALDQKLQNEAGVLDLLVSAYARGQDVEALWDKLHASALRDDRLGELAFAYERISRDRRVTSLTAAVQSRLLDRAGAYFADVFGDLDGAEGFLERALSLTPTDNFAFEKLESLFVQRNKPIRLSELYANAAPHQAEREDQLVLLRRAAELVDGVQGEEARAIKLYLEILKILPGDDAARKGLEQRFIQAGRHADLGKLLEQWLLGEGALTGGDAIAIRARLIGLYADKLGEIERALPHVEEVLRADPVHAKARDIADKLLSHKALAARAAALLDGVHEKLGNPAEAARMLGIQIEQLRGPRRLEAQKRLALLHHKYPDEFDAEKAYSLDEAIVALDPADDVVRQRYLQRSLELDKRLEATRVLTRAANGCKDQAAKSRIGAEVGDLLVALGDPRKARLAYQGVLEQGGDETALLRAARAMDRIASDARDHRGLATVLNRLSELEPEEEARISATERMAQLCEGELKDPAGAITAYKRLVGTAREAEALRALEPLLEASSAHAELAMVLGRRAETEPDREAARALSFRAAEIRSKLPDKPAALEAWRSFVTTFGPSKESLARLIPLLEHERAWEELAPALENEAELSPEETRAPIFARIGQLRLTRLSDARGALDAYARALALDPSERTSRAALDKLLTGGDLRLRAADVLEPIFRLEKAAAGIVKVLEARGALLERIEDRLTALEEACIIARLELKDPKRALELAGRGLFEALRGAREEVERWLERIEALSAAASDGGRAAAVLKQALGDGPVEDPTTALVAKRTAEALVGCGDITGALAVFRAALAFEPSSPELLERIDTLLREQGSPEERIALYRAALEQPCDPLRRRELLHAIGAIERRDLGNAKAAAATYKRALDEDPTDRVAYEGLLELYEAESDWTALYEELERGLLRETDEERSRTLLRLAEVATARGTPDRAAEHYRELLESGATVAEEALSTIETLAYDLGDAALSFAVLDRRVASAVEPMEEAVWLEKLGDLLSGRLARPDEAIARYRKAAERAETALDSALAQRLCERVLALSPNDRGAAERLVRLYRDSAQNEKLANVYELLLRTSVDRVEAVRTLLDFASVATAARALERFVREADALLSKDLAPDQRKAIRAARAKVLASDPETMPRASAAYRQMVEEGDADAAQAFEAFIDARGAQAFEDRRWLHTFRVDHAAEIDQPALYLSWAQFEESAKDPARACELYGKLLAIDPENDDALAARARLLRDLGDLEGAARAIEARRDRSEGSARAALELELGELLLERLDRPDEALTAIAPVLETTPTDATAKRLVERALARPETMVRAARILERACDAAADDPELASSFLDVLLSTPADAPELLEARRGWYERLLDREGQPDARSLDIVLRAVHDLPHDVGLWERAERIARALERADLVAEAYRRELARLAKFERMDPDAIEDVGRRAVEFHEEWFDEPEAVIGLLRKIVELVPTSGWAFERLKLVYNLGERWDELFTLYDDVIAAAADRSLRIDLLEDAALTAKDLASDATRAVPYYEALLALRPAAKIQAALERLYERLGDHRKLIDLLAPSLASLEGDALHKQRARIATLWLEGLGDGKTALAMAEPLLEIPSTRSEGLGLVERVLAASNHPERQEGSRETERRAAQILRKHYETEGRAKDLARILTVELAASENAGERVERLRALVPLYLGELADEHRAFDSLAELVTLEPEVLDHRNEIARLAERLDEHARFAEVLTAAAEQARPVLRTELLAQAARVFDRRLGDRDKAIELSRTILSSSRNDQDAELGAARELSRLLADAGRTRERSEVLERLAELETDTEARRAAHAEIARIALYEAGDPERAIRAFRAELALAPAGETARDGLIEALDRAGRNEELATALRERASQREGDLARADRVRVAKLCEGPLASLDRAVTAWAELRTEHGADAESADALASLLERMERYVELVELFESEANASTTPGRAAELWRRLGDVHREKTGDLPKAVAAYERALDELPSETPARRGLETIAATYATADADGLPVVRAAVKALVRHATAQGDDAALVALLEARVAVADDAEGRAATLVATAALFEKGGNSGGAFDATFRAFLLTPEESLAAEVTRLGDAAERWASVAEALDGDLGTREDVALPIARGLFAKVSAWRAERGELELAEQAMERALAKGPPDVGLLERLADLQRRAPGRSLIVTLLRLSEAKEGDLDRLREAVDVAIDPVADRVLAKTLAEKLLDASEAAWSRPDAWSSERFASPSEAASWSLDVLVRLLHDEGPARLVDLFLRGARLPFDAGERRRLRLRAAEVADVDATIAIYRELFEEDPTDELATQKLEGLYRTHGRKVELLVLRERQIAVAPTLERRLDLRFELASLLADAGEAAQAIAALKENLEHAPGHRASVSKLLALLEAGGHHQDLAAQCEEQGSRAAAEGDNGNAAAMWAKAATIAETRLGDPERAIAGHKRAAELGAPASLDALARLYTQRGAHGDAAEMLDRLLEKAAAEAVPALLLRLADALVASGKPDVARTRLAASMGTSPGFSPVRERLATLYREAAEWAPLAALYAEDASRAPDRQKRAARLRDAAALYLDRCNDPASAIPLLEQAKELAPDDLGAKLTLCSALAAAGRPEEAASTLKGIIAAYGGRRPKERALVHYHLARVSLASGDRPRALGELDAAHRIDPAHPEILHALARLTLEEGQLDRAARTYRALLLVVRRPRDEDGALSTTTVTRAEVLLELAEIAERQEEADRAAEHLESAFEAARESPEERIQLFGALRKRGKHAVLARALEARIAGLPPGDELGNVLGELAELYEGPLDKQELALDARIRALGLAPSSAPVREKALDLARKHGKVERYLAALSGLAESASPELAADLSIALGKAFESEVKDDAKAAEAYRRAEAGMPAKDRRLDDVWRALEHVYERLHDAEARAAVLAKRIEASEDDPGADRSDPLYRLAGLRLAHKDTQAEGLDLLERALGIAPDIDRVEAMLHDALTSDQESRVILRFFERFARDNSRQRSLVEVLVLIEDMHAKGLLMPSAEDPLREAVDVALALEDSTLAESLLRRVLQGDEASSDPKKGWAMVALADLCAERGDVAEAADVREKAARLFDAEEGRTLLLQVAAASKGPLDDLPRATRIYEELRTREPAEREIWEPLADAYRRQAEVEKLAALLAETAPLVDTLAEKSAMVLERARLVMATDEELAQRLLHEVIDDDPSQLEAAITLSGMLERAGKNDELAALLAKQVEGAKDRQDASSIISLSLRLGALLERRGSEQDALDVYHSALDWDKSAREVLRAVLRIALARKDSLDLGEALAQMLAIEVGEPAAQLAITLSDLRTTHGDPAGAEQALEQGYAACPTSIRVRDELVARYTAREAWSKLAALHVSDAETRTSREERLQAFRRAADVYREQAGDTKSAAEVLTKALEENPSDREMLTALVDAYGQTREFGKAIDAISKALETSPDDGGLYQTRASFHEAMGKDQLALIDLERAYEKSNGGYATELVIQLERAVAWCADSTAPEVRAGERALRLRAAEILEKSGDVERARMHLSDLAKRDGKDRAVLRALATLEDNERRWNASSAVYRKLLALEDGDALVETALKLADACDRDNRLGDARGGLERALRVAPNNVTVRARLRTLYQVSGARSELSAMILEDAAAAPDVTGRFALLLNAGRLLLESDARPDIERAIAVLEEARGLMPEEHETTILLADAYAFVNRRPEARALLDAAVAVHKGRRSKQLGPVYRRLARLDREDGDLVKALAAITKAFENDPHNGSLAMELGLFAMERSELDLAQRAFRSVTMMKVGAPGSGEGTTAASRAVAYHHLGRMASANGDKRKARMMLEKAVVDDPSNEEAKALLERLRSA